MSDEIGLTAVILCGGSGTRLWPLSRRDMPKQFAVKQEGKSLFQRTYERASAHPWVETIVCVSHQDYRFAIQSMARDTQFRGKLLLEPAPRNTAAAIACAALLVARDDSDAVLACLPADHDIHPVEEFQQSLTRAAQVANDGWLTILATIPHGATTAFGYVLPGEPLPNAAYARRLSKFVEKPSEDRAKEFVQAGYRWNCGIVIARADVLIEAIGRHDPDLLACCMAALPEEIDESAVVSLDANSFLNCENISFDHAVLEREDRIAVVDLDASWSDVGHWSELAELYPADEKGNRLVGAVEAQACDQTFVLSPERLTVALGLQDTFVIDTSDALLVADRSKLGDLKDVISNLIKKGRAEVASHRRVLRPWGAYECVDRGKNFLVKRITVTPGEALSLQYHRHRSEHWIVVSGQAVVTCGEEKFVLKTNQATYIPKGAVHRLANSGQEILELVEVQSGSYLGEDDTVRLEDKYGRDDDPT
jgi:mannose-1-phosphate guanylyltransferase/mannose-6-phosphate isomerase